ncbi:MAG: NIPSNAP family protein [Caldimonas sp.]
MNTATSTPIVNAPALEDCRIIELRDYLLHPAQREVLIELFDRAFVESQEALAMRVIGQFRDLDRPDHFVWLRGFADMASRRHGLESFYGGPAWAAHRDAANATMIDSSDVRLLRYARQSWSLVTPAALRPRAGVDLAASTTLFELTQCSLRTPVDETFRRWFEREALPALIDSGAAPCAVFETESASNDFTRLPVRTGEHVFAWLVRHANPEAAARAADRLASAHWFDAVLPRLQRASAEPMRVLRLQPTSRSLLR